MSSHLHRPGTVVEIRRFQPHSTHATLELGVILHCAMTWFVAYFPGDAQRLPDPADPASIRIIATTAITDTDQVIAYHDLIDCDPAWVLSTWKQLLTVGPGMLGEPQVVHLWEVAATIAELRLDAHVALLITREQLECWAGRSLNDDDLEQLDNAIPHSTIPETIGEIVDEMDSETIG